MRVALLDSHYFPLNRAIKRKPRESIGGSSADFYGQFVGIRTQNRCEIYTIELLEEGGPVSLVRSESLNSQLPQFQREVQCEPHIGIVEILLC